jgi:hypothetical protein
MLMYKALVRAFEWSRDIPLTWKDIRANRAAANIANKLKRSFNRDSRRSTNIIPFYKCSYSPWML